MGIATKEGLCSTFMPSLGLISEPHQASQAFVHPGHEHTHEWESPVISLALLHACPTFISKHHSFQPQESKCSTKVPVEEGFSPSKFSGEPLKFSSHHRGCNTLARPRVNSTAMYFPWESPSQTQNVQDLHGSA